MLVYNKIAEVVADQFIIIALFEVITVGIIFFVSKKRLTLKTFLISIFIALILSLTSTIIARGIMEEHFITKSSVGLYSIIM